MPLPDAPDYSKRIYELLKETDLENLSYAQFQGVAEKLFIEPENEDEMRRLILIQMARTAVRGDWDGFLTGGGGGGGAPTNAEYVVMSLNGTLTNERVLTAGTGISLTDGGAGSTITIASTVSAAPVDAQYVTLATDGKLTNERVLTAGSGITLTDGGAGSTITIAASGGGGGSTFLPVAWYGTGIPIMGMAPYGNANYTTQNVANDTVYYHPFIAPRDMTVSTTYLHLSSASSSGALAEVAIYSNYVGRDEPQTLMCKIALGTGSTGYTSSSSWTSVTTLNLTGGETYWMAHLASSGSADGFGMQVVNSLARSAVAKSIGNASQNCLQDSTTAATFPTTPNVSQTNRAPWCIFIEEA
tara:strand:+ start:223 stop:1296 length:1074 start_codon:yes stop_codon:yes gene_type:complete